jgi:Ca2+/Na+ antiporter
MVELIFFIYTVFLGISCYISYKTLRQEYENGYDITIGLILLLIFISVCPLLNMYFVVGIGKDYLNFNFVVIKGKKT